MTPITSLSERIIRADLRIMRGLLMMMKHERRSRDREREPDMPAGLNRAERRQYQKGRDRAFAELGRRFDGNVATTMEI